MLADNPSRLRFFVLCVALALVPAAPTWAAKGDVDLVSRAAAKGDGRSWSPSISADGRLVAFASQASNLHPDDGDGGWDIFVRDVETSATTLVSRAAAKANGESELPAISADGRFVAFSSEASNLHPDDTDGTWDVFVRDLQTNTTTLVSRATGGAKGNADSSYTAISADGRFVAFGSEASNLDPGDTDGLFDVYVRDLEANTTTLVSRGVGVKGDNNSYDPAISADGRVVAFISQATNLHPDDGDNDPDVLVRDLESNTLTLASRATGVAGAKSDGGSLRPRISADGRVVAFMSQSTNLDPGDDGDDDQDVFVRDLAAHTTALVSRANGPTGASANRFSADPALSADGRLVAFVSEGSNLHPDDADARYDVFVRDVDASTTTLASRGPTGTKGTSYSYDAAISADGRYVAFASAATNLHSEDGDDTLDVFRRDVRGVAPEAADDAYVMNEDTSLTVDGPGVLGNDTDADGDGLTAALASGPAHGSLQLEADGSLTYTPGADYNGSDSFTYRVSDGDLQSGAATVTIEIRLVEDPAPAGPASSTGPASSAPPALAEPAIAQLRLGSRCVRRSASGRVRVPMTMRLAQPGAVHVRIDRAVGSKARRHCPRRARTRDHVTKQTRYRRVATMRDAPTRAAAAAVKQRLMLDLRLAPGLYRITVRAQLGQGRLSRPVRRFLRVTG